MVVVQAIVGSRYAIPFLGLERSDGGYMLLSSKQSSTAAVVTFEAPLDLHEAASILGMHYKTLEKKARNREIPAMKLGKRWKFRLSSLNSWLETGLKSNTTDQAVVTRREQHP